MSRKLSLFIGSTLLIILGLLLVLATSAVEPKEEQAMVTLRKIGHQILLSAGDSTSRILPIERINSNSYVISFQRAFIFDAEELVKIADHYIKKDALPSTFLLEIVENETKAVVYSYQVKKFIDQDIPCIKRNQPKGAYKIKISFTNPSFSTGSLNHLFPLLILPLALIFIFPGVTRFITNRTVKTPDTTKVDIDRSSIPLGKFLFSFKNRTLRYDNQLIELSTKEVKILSFFAERPNEIIDRDLLLKEIWENEGVFVGRSLDVFISKLRKKLQLDQSVKIVNIHGKGYKLEVPN